jgi:cellulose biosynthesis protein BcsQ
MKVISFHSYKGGRGRTTSITSIANLYARTGKNVVLLDLDATAPWLHTRYDLSREDLESRAWLMGLLPQLFDDREPDGAAIDIADFSIELGGLDRGSVRLITPGNPETDDYWRWMVEEFPRFLGVRADPHITGTWRRLRAVIEAASPSPDLLLVDAPAGYHLASVYVATGIADTAILFTQADHADAAWTTQMVRRMREVRPQDTKERYGPLSLIGVRARYPDYIHTEAESAERFRTFQEAYASARFDDWVSLESDPRVELTNLERPISLTEPIPVTRLVKGYSELLAAALGEGRSRGATLLESLPEGSLVPGERPQFFLLQEQGILTNPADRSRNVSFRVETFCGLLNDLHDELKKAANGAGTTMAENGEGLTREPSALERAGEKPGKRFGEDLAKQLEQTMSSPDDETRLRHWCEFDSRVGFGGLNLKELDPMTSAGSATAGVIEVTGNFLAAQGKPSDLCSLLTGYIKGVLSMLLRNVPKDVQVDHPSGSCMGQAIGTRSSCEFSFSIPAETAKASE